MKKISPEQRRRLIIISLKREKRNRVSKNKKLLKNRAKSGNDYRRIDRVNYCTILGPEILGCSTIESRNALVSWLTKLRETTIRKKRPVFIDFRMSAKAEVVGFILMQAEIDRIQSIKGKSYVRGNSPNDPIAAQVFHQVGLSSLLGIKGDIPITDKDVVYWNHTHGTKIEGDKGGKLIVEIAKAHDLDDSITDNLYNGVSEAITNSVMHAYPDDRSEDVRYLYGKKKWWMFTGINEDILHVVVCDLGIGIPNSLKHKHPDLYEKFKSLFRYKNHSKLIQVAMEEGRSRSDEPHRGLGMVELKNFINFTHNGKLAIFSQKGGFLYFGDGGENIERLRNFKGSMMGTVVAWSVPLETLSSIGSKSYEENYN